MSAASQSEQHRKLVSDAIRSNALALLRVYKKRGIDIRACWVETDETRQSIVLAARLGNAAAIRVLCELGADVNTPDDKIAAAMALLCS
jgi:hypothetical protein